MIIQINYHVLNEDVTSIINGKEEALKAINENMQRNTKSQRTDESCIIFHLNYIINLVYQSVNTGAPLVMNHYKFTR